MISRTHRFRHRFAVQAVYKNAKTIKGPMMSLKYTKKEGQPWRAAVVVSKKVTKSAVKRNRIRRRIFEWIRKREDKIRPGSQLIVSVFDEKIATMKYEQLDKILRDMFTKMD